MSSNNDVSNNELTQELESKKRPCDIVVQCARVFVKIADEPEKDEKGFTTFTWRFKMGEAYDKLQAAMEVYNEQRERSQLIADIIG